MLNRCEFSSGFLLARIGLLLLTISQFFSVGWLLFGVWTGAEIRHFIDAEARSARLADALIPLRWIWIRALPHAWSLFLPEVHFPHQYLSYESLNVCFSLDQTVLKIFRMLFVLVDQFNDSSNFSFEQVLKRSRLRMWNRQFKIGLIEVLFDLNEMLETFFVWRFLIFEHDHHLL